MRRALTRALRRHTRARSSTRARRRTMLQPRGRLRGARRALRRACRRQPAGTRRTGLQHVLERRALRRVRLLLPLGPRAERRGARGARRHADGRAAGRDRPASGARAGPRAGRGLLRRQPRQEGPRRWSVAAWALAAPADWRLRGHRHRRRSRAGGFLAERGVAEPAGVEWAGVVPQDRYRGAARVGRAVRVGLALRGLRPRPARGAGRRLAARDRPAPAPTRRSRLARELEPGWSRDAPRALATALRAALEMPEAGARRYRERARELLRPHSRGGAAAARRRRRYCPCCSLPTGRLPDCR